MSAARVNWETARTLPPTSSSARFIFPAASSKTRRPPTFLAASSACEAASPFSAPTRTSKPRPICPTTFPPTRTSARETRWTTSLIGASPPPPDDLPQLSRLRGFQERRRDPVDCRSRGDDEGEKRRACPAAHDTTVNNPPGGLDRGAPDGGCGRHADERGRDRPSMKPAFARSEDREQDRQVHARRRRRGQPDPRKAQRSGQDYAEQDEGRAVGERRQDRQARVLERVESRDDDPHS